MRAAVAILTVSVALSTAPLMAQRTAGPELRGIPASVTSPRSDGSLRGIPGSVTDPRASTHGFRGGVSFGNLRPSVPFHHPRPTPVVVVPYYAYSYLYDYSTYEEPQPVQTAQPQVIVIKEEAEHPEESSRYGDHSFEERQPEHEQAAPPNPAPVQQAEDLGPMTTLVYRDGHKTELRNYAIVGSNLLDLTKTPVIKKIPLASLDIEATRRENEENGVDFHLP